MHTAAARKRGESEERLYLLDAWRESHAGPCRTGVDLCPAHVAARALRLHQWLARVRHRRAGRYAANHRAAARERQDRCNLRHPQSGQVASYCGSSPALSPFRHEASVLPRDRRRHSFLPQMTERSRDQIFIRHSIFDQTIGAGKTHQTIDAPFYDAEITREAVNGLMRPAIN